MSKKSNKTLIGGFVLGAIVLVVIGVLLFGSGKFFAKLTKYVLYFEGSVKGLNIGAPVVFRGVKVGTVTDIMIVFDPETLSFYVPVIIEVEADRFERILPKGVTEEEIEERNYSRALIERGLRAQLILQSFVTGQLWINFDLYPDRPARFVELKSKDLDIKYPEIPTIPTPMQELQKTLEEIPIHEIAQKLEHTLDGIDRLVNSPDLHESFTSLNLALKDMRKLVRNVDRKVEPLATSFEGAGDAARDALLKAENTLSSIRNNLSENSKMNYEIRNMLEELASAARSIRLLTDYLEQHPEALLRGKGGS